jgi:hypothetical protein
VGTDQFRVSAAVRSWRPPAHAVLRRQLGPGRQAIDEFRSDTGRRSCVVHELWRADQVGAGCRISRYSPGRRPARSWRATPPLEQQRNRHDLVMAVVERSVMPPIEGATPEASRGRRTPGTRTARRDRSVPPRGRDSGDCCRASTGLPSCNPQQSGGTDLGESDHGEVSRSGGEVTVARTDEP